MEKVLHAMDLDPNKDGLFESSFFWGDQFDSAKSTPPPLIFSKELN